MKSDSKTYRFFFGQRGDRWLPIATMMLILVPILIVALYFDGRKHNAIASNPVFTKTVVSKVYSIGHTPRIDYYFNAESVQYRGSYAVNGLAVGDSIGVVYQKDNPENNMTVFEYYDGPEYGATTIITIIAIVLVVYRWLKLNRKYNERCPELDGSGRCMIYRTDKEYIFVTVYYANSSYPIKFLPFDCDNGAFENTLTDIFHASLHYKYTEIKASELIKAMKQRSWRQLYMHSTSVLVTHDSHKLKILPTKKTAGKWQDWDYDRKLSFDLDGASWKDIINSIRKLFEPNETNR